MANPAQIQKRAYGRTQDMLSVIGFGGIVVRDTSADEAARLVGEAYERGVNYFDVAPSYGNAEQMLGPALEPYRKDCFLACKTQQRDAAGAQAELEQSLKNLRTDHLDLYQLHALTDTAADVDAVFARGGAFDVLLQARKEGRVRYLGFSAHATDAALAALDRYDFDSVLFPVNYTAWHQAEFGPAILEKALEKGAARLALKAMALQQRPKDKERQWTRIWYEPTAGRDRASRQLRWTLSQNVTAAIPPGEPELFRLALDIAQDLQPLTDDELAKLSEQARDLTPIFE
jgi:predicted aldo/keto reductase-like oxidoreductase